jgi:hypothetical protein
MLWWTRVLGFGLGFCEPIQIGSLICKAAGPAHLLNFCSMSNSCQFEAGQSTIANQGGSGPDAFVAQVMRGTGNV